MLFIAVNPIYRLPVRQSLGLFPAIGLHTYTTIMPIWPIFGIHIFSDSYKITVFAGGQKVTIVVKKYVKKLSKEGQKGSGGQEKLDFSAQESELFELKFWQV